MSTRALALQHGESGPPGLLADWARDRDIELDVHRVDLQPELPSREPYAFIVSLGSKHNPTEQHVEEVAVEHRYLSEAVTDTPVLGLCFGGQMLASVLGAEIERAPEPELGWHRLDSYDDDIGAGPWLQWHFDRFTLPPGATALAASPVGLQAFASGRHLGVQFHPESTIEIVARWALADQTRLTDLGFGDGQELVEQGRAHAAEAARAAYALFDAFWRRQGES